MRKTSSVRKSILKGAGLVLAVGLLGGCQTVSGWFGSGSSGVDIGATGEVRAATVATGLMNPSSIDFLDDGSPIVCDTGNGRVVRITSSGVKPYVRGFKTEYWKVDAATGAKRFKLGPLSVVSLGGGQLAVTNAGLLDGEEHVAFFRGPGDAACGFKTNSVGPTTDIDGDLGEGNLSGMALSPCGRYLWVCGQGSDARTWLLRCDMRKGSLVTFASADDWGLDVNSPMQCRVKPNGNVLVLYSGEGGKEDGLIAEWDAVTGSLVATWSLPGLINPMGMDFIPGGGGTLAVVGNNWALTEVKSGKLARVTLPKGGGKAQVEVVATNLRGPTACQFGPDGRLYICELGEQFDSDKGRVLKISGL